MVRKYVAHLFNEDFNACAMHLKRNGPLSQVSKKIPCKHETCMGCCMKTEGGGKGLFGVVEKLSWSAKDNFFNSGRHPPSY